MQRQLRYGKLERRELHTIQSSWVQLKQAEAIFLAIIKPIQRTPNSVRLGESDKKEKR
jgi:hypothetical protein